MNSPSNTSPSNFDPLEAVLSAERIAQAAMLLANSNGSVNNHNNNNNNHNNGNSLCNEILMMDSLKSAGVFVRQNEEEKRKSEKGLALRDAESTDIVTKSAGMRSTDCNTITTTATTTTTAANGSKKNGAYVMFPRNLHDLLDNAESLGFDSIISWMPDGKSFRIHEPWNMEHIIKTFFNQNKFKSFLRQLQNYGFDRVLRGKDRGICRHPLFVRGRRDMGEQMKRISALKKKQQQQAQAEQQKLLAKTVEKTCGKTPPSTTSMMMSSSSSLPKTLPGFATTNHNGNSNNGSNSNSNGSNFSALEAHLKAELLNQQHAYNQVTKQRLATAILLKRQRATAANSRSLQGSMMPMLMESSDATTNAAIHQHSFSPSTFFGKDGLGATTPTASWPSPQRSLSLAALVSQIHNGSTISPQSISSSSLIRDASCGNLGGSNMMMMMSNQQNTPITTETFLSANSNNNLSGSVFGSRRSSFNNNNNNGLGGYLPGTHNSPHGLFLSSTH